MKKTNTLDKFIKIKPKEEKQKEIQDSQEIQALRRNKTNPYLPLPEKQRPKKLEDIIGQEHILGKGKPLHTMIMNDKIQSTIIYGPPGCGKTTIAKLIQQTTQNEFISLSATTAKKEDFKKVIESAQMRKKCGINTILFVDEIHTLNKLQQDTFLPSIENGTIILIGATTENPSFELNNALMSRCQLVTLNKLTENDIVCILRKAIDEEYKMTVLDMNDESLRYISSISEGDGRNSLKYLEKIFTFFKNMPPKKLESEMRNKGGIDIELEEKLKRGEISIIKIGGEIKTIVENKEYKKSEQDNEKKENEIQEEKTEIEEEKNNYVAKKYIITKVLIEKFLQNIQFYENENNERNNIMNAFHKSITHSDVEATLYWLEKLIQIKENPKFITRRMIRISTEDIGLADINALNLAVRTFQIVNHLGYPECSTGLYECALYLARAPKSCVVLESMKRTEEIIKETGSLPVPLHIRNAPTELMSEMGYGCDYKYPPNYNEVLDQTYLPEKLIGTQLVYHDKFVKPINKDDIIMKCDHNKEIIFTMTGKTKENDDEIKEEKKDEHVISDNENEEIRKVNIPNNETEKEENDVIVIDIDNEENHKKLEEDNIQPRENETKKKFDLNDLLNDNDDNSNDDIVIIDNNNIVMINDD